jgi:hypothetical protein
MLKEEVPVDCQTIEQLRHHVKQARNHLRAARRLLPGLVSLTDEDRECSTTIVDMEHALALQAVVRVMTMVPDYFADQFELDPPVFNLEIAERTIEGWIAMRPLVEELEEAAREMSDHSIWSGECLRMPVEFGSADRALDLAETNPEVQKVLGRYSDYWKKRSYRKKWRRERKKL